MRPPRISGHCLTPQQVDPELSHRRCAGGNRWNPQQEFSPCPCKCHLGDEEFECANCGGSLRVALHWPNEDEPGEPVYVHINPSNGRAIGEECEHMRRAAEPEDDEPEDTPVEDTGYEEIPLTEVIIEEEPDDDLDDFDDLDDWDFDDDE